MPAEGRPWPSDDDDGDGDDNDDDNGDIEHEQACDQGVPDERQQHAGLPSNLGGMMTMMMMMMMMIVKTWSESGPRKETQTKAGIVERRLLYILMSDTRPCTWW